MTKIETIGLDLGKDLFQVHGVDSTGRVTFQKTLMRAEVTKYFGSIRPCLVGIEATGTSHHWARTLRRCGHSVKLMPAAYVKPYVKTNKNDAADAEAICEAVRRPTMRFVPIKTEKQQASLMMHRVREVLVRQRVTLSITLRALLAEFGIVARRGHAGLRETLAFVEAPRPTQIPKPARKTLQCLVDAIRSLIDKIKAREADIAAEHDANARSRLLTTIPYVGRVTAHALISTIGDASQFRSSRELAAWIGLVPRQHSSGGKQRLGRISKAGDRYLRKLLYFAARRAVHDQKLARHQVFRWARNLRKRKTPRVANVALAAKLARIIWAMLRHNRAYSPTPTPATC